MYRACPETFLKIGLYKWGVIRYNKQRGSCKRIVALVAQLDRVVASEAKGRGFESLQVQKMYVHDIVFGADRAA